MMVNVVGYLVAPKGQKFNKNRTLTVRRGI